MRKSLYTTLKGKVILATITGLITILAIHSAIYYAFDEITENIDLLGKPNEKLISVNRLFRDVSQLNNLQRQEAATGRRNPSIAFIQESDAIYRTLDTLTIIFADDSIQSARIHEIYNLLNLREQHFLDYLELQSRLSSDPGMRRILTQLSEKSRSEQRDDIGKILKSEVTTTTRTTSSDTIREGRQGFFRRLFSRGQENELRDIVHSETIVDESTKVIVDTLTLGSTSELIGRLESSFDSLQNQQLKHASRLQQAEMRLLNTNNGIIYEIINIINSLEQDEINVLNATTQSTLTIAKATIKRLNMIAIAFITVSAILVLLIIIDITRTNTYRRKLEQMHAEARQEAEAKQRFLSNMSHEIRTPLQAIYGYAEQARINPDHPTNIDAIYQSSGHLLDVVNEVLDYAKVTSGKLSFETKPFLPFDQIETVAKTMQYLAQQKGLKFTFAFDGDEKTALLGDAYRLRQILYNLTGNAIKFTEKGEVTITATLTQEAKKAAALQIEVMDTGIGIRPEKLEDIFNEFGQTDPSVTEKFGGTGLGLTIVKRLVELQSGQIDIESTEGTGTRFTVSIPYQTTNETVAINMQATSETVRPKINAVWFADDDPLILNLGKTIIEKNGIPCRTFNDGISLLTAYEKAEAEVIFLDMRMPGMNGGEVCRRIRQMSKSQNSLRIYALTAQALPGEQSDILKNGFDGLIIKPFRESDIIDALNNSIKTNGEALPFDIKNLIKMTGDDPEILLDILKSIRDESQKDLVQMEKELWLNHKENISLLAHRLAGRVGQIGAMNYAMELRAAERELEDKNKLPNLKMLVHKLTKGGNAFLQNLELLIAAQESKNM
ncbi:hybrid sensor histidine kinase/response regulator [Alkaliflexus imshenetskii]|uniref:hybrid sensor histidine kinase/response regulator n=1 Tax=Alkaliflexus imshenetskii TaxID=286730 RepID=UPI000479D36E|nr:ATP-binding protein [Alkaliflexus imshenetskii]